MKHFNPSDVASLRWIQPKLSSREFELFQGDEVIASLRWTTTFGSTVSIETAAGAWSIRRFGLFWRHGSIRRVGDVADAATFDFGWFGRLSMTTQSGDQYRWRRSKFWPPTWTFSNASGFPIARFTLTGMMFRSKGSIELLENASLHHADLPVLLYIGWYLVVVIQRRRRRRS